MPTILSCMPRAPRVLPTAGFFMMVVASFSQGQQAGETESRLNPFTSALKLAAKKPANLQVAVKRLRLDPPLAAPKRS